MSFLRFATRRDRYTALRLAAPCGHTDFVRRPAHCSTNLAGAPKAIERQMAHGTANDVRRHYNYAQYLPERRVLMQAWADYLDELRTSDSTGEVGSRQP